MLKSFCRLFNTSSKNSQHLFLDSVGCLLISELIRLFACDFGRNRFLTAHSIGGNNTSFYIEHVLWSRSIFHLYKSVQDLIDFYLPMH